MSIQCGLIVFWQHTGLSLSKFTVYMHCTYPHREANRVMTEVEFGGLRLGVLLHSHLSSSSAAAAGKLPLH